jgi:hypothetical protein
MDLMGSVNLLDGFASGEFHSGIVAVLDDPDEYRAFKRLGRLAAVSIKSPFAVSREYDRRGASIGLSQAANGASLRLRLRPISQRTATSTTFSSRSLGNGISRFRVWLSTTSSSVFAGGLHQFCAANPKL